MIYLDDVILDARRISNMESTIIFKRDSRQVNLVIKNGPQMKLGSVNIDRAIFEGMNDQMLKWFSIIKKSEQNSSSEIVG
mmetsp:Transcript_18794/g.17932  ORF Transcript_18794/g.17932 Transcript_18794/m.17932 type:complete len:80 (+) Transcript_18794:78-317(+)